MEDGDEEECRDIVIEGFSDKEDESNEVTQCELSSLMAKENMQSEALMEILHKIESSKIAIGSLKVRPGNSNVN